MQFGYLLGKAVERPLILTVNGNVIGLSYIFTFTGSWCAWT